MNEDGFIDYYELLQLSPNADTDTIERVFRYLAKRYHPDNKESGDTDRFLVIVEAHKTLSDPEKRAGYDVKYQDYWNSRWKLTSEAKSRTDFGDDWEDRESLLSILYLQRRHYMKQPGLGNHELARMLDKPLEFIEFHMWYLKSKGLVERLENGRMAITALGVDHIEQNRLRLRKDRLLTAGTASPEEQYAGPGRFETTDLPEFPKDAGSN